MNIVIDAFGGDNAPLEVIKGAIDAHNDFQVDITLVGDEQKIKDCAKNNGLDISALAIRHADTVIDVCEEPTAVVKGKKDCSMALGMKMLADGEGDAFLSAGSTGALVVGATMIVRRIKGIKRPALATVLPTAGAPTMLLDSGANADCRPEMLTQFGIMGSAYMNKILGVDTPRVALANIGSEESKGRELELETYRQLTEAPVNFIAGTKNKLAALMIMSSVKEFKKKVDYSEYGGAPLLGTAKPVIKAHGSSDAKAFYNAVRQAKLFTETGVIDEITAALADMKKAKENA